MEKILQIWKHLSDKLQDERIADEILPYAIDETVVVEEFWEEFPFQIPIPELVILIGESAFQKFIDCRDHAFIVNVEFDYRCENRLAIEELESISKGKNHAIKSINLSCFQFGTPLSEIIYKLLQSTSNLEKFNCSENYIGDTGVVEICKNLKCNTTLKVLSLAGNNISSNGLNALGEALKVNTSLQKLDLSYNRIRGRYILNLGEALKTNSTLLELDLESNEIGKWGIIKIAEGLQMNSTLQVLNLNMCAITPEGICVLVPALLINSTLKKLFLASNYINNMATMMTNVLKYNKSLREIDLSQNDLTMEEELAISQALKMNTQLKIHSN